MLYCDRPNSTIKCVMLCSVTDRIFKGALLFNRLYVLSVFNKLNGGWDVGLIQLVIPHLHINP